MIIGLVLHQIFRRHSQHPQNRKGGRFLTLPTTHHQPEERWNGVVNVNHAANVIRDTRECDLRRQCSLRERVSHIGEDDLLEFVARERGVYAASVTKKKSRSCLLRGAAEVILYTEFPLIQQPFWNVEPISISLAPGPKLRREGIGLYRESQLPDLHFEFRTDD